MRDPQITLELKRHLADYYRACCKTVDVRFTDKKHGNSEYLVDFCVITEGHRMDTAIESEWKTGLKRIEEDFKKLLHVKSSLKVMICDSKDYVRDRLVPAVTFLNARCKNCEPGETYMIFNWRGNRRVANCHVWTPTEKGFAESEPIRFRCLPGFPAIVSNSIAHPNDGWLGELD